MPAHDIIDKRSGNLFETKSDTQFPDLINLPNMGKIIPEMGMIIPDMGINTFERRVSSYLFNKTRRGLLALLFGRPDESFYVNQILQQLGSGSGAVQRELKMMTEAGIIVREKKGNLVYYQANSSSPIFNELKNIVRKTFGVADDTVRYD